MPRTASQTLRQTMRWGLAPATQDSRLQDVGYLVLRVTLGLMWLYSVVWKRPPDFGAGNGSGLYRFTEYGVTYPVLAPYAWLLETLVLPAIPVLGWGVLAAETALAVLLLTGLHVRLAALLGIGQVLAIILSVLVAPDEWPWSYYLMLVGHIVLLLGASARLGALDAVRASRSVPVRQATVWAALGVVVGAWSIIRTVGDPLASPGQGFHRPKYELSLGVYNTLGGALLVVVALLVWWAVRTGRAAPALVAAALGALAALSIWVQLALGSSTLGASQTSAAFYLCLAAVAAVVTHSLRRGENRPAPPTDR